MTKISVAAILVVSTSLALSACASQPEATQLPDKVPVAPAGLEGTQWRLVEFQSMDDAQGTTRPDDPDKYTMSLMPDGRVAFRLNCNRGNGSWQSTPAGDGMSGSISFGLLATTKALCPPPSMDEQIARDTQYMRGYILRDGKLAVSLMADGGIYLWEPLPDN